MQNWEKRERRKTCPTTFESEVVVLPQQIFSASASFHQQRHLHENRAERSRLLDLTKVTVCPDWADTRANSSVKSVFLHVLGWLRKTGLAHRTSVIRKEVGYN